MKVCVDVLELARMMGFLAKHKGIGGRIDPQHLMNYLVNTHRKVKLEDLEAAFNQAL